MAAEYKSVPSAGELEAAQPKHAEAASGKPLAQNGSSGASTKAKPARIASVDIARGFTMFWMIMVDNQGSHTPSDIWYPWRESEWNGIGPADCVFPAFLFLAGFSITLALTRYRAAWAVGGEPQRKAVWSVMLWKVVPRFLKLFAIGAFINLWAGGFKVQHWVIMGVLQRIGVCYLVLALAYVFLPSIWAVRGLTLACLALYACIMYAVDVPGCGRANLSPACNAGGWASRQLWGPSHVPSDGTIPEALVSTLAAMVTTEAGLEFGLIMREARGSHPYRLLLLWGITSVLYAALGGGLSLAVPLNKKLWSPPFALVVSAVAGFMLCMWLFIVDLRCGLDVPPRWWTLEWIYPERPRPPSPGRPATPPSRSSSLNVRGKSTKQELKQPLLAATPTPPSPALDSLPITGPTSRCCGCPCCACCDSATTLSVYRAAVAVGDACVVQPLTWLGRNPALTFIAMVALEVLLMDTLKDGGTPVWTKWYEEGFVPGCINRQAASSAVALVHVALWVAICGVLHYFKIFITL